MDIDSRLLAELIKRLGPEVKINPHDLERHRGARLYREDDPYTGVATIHYQPAAIDSTCVLVSERVVGPLSGRR